MQKQITKNPHNKKSLFTLLLTVCLMQTACAQDNAANKPATKLAESVAPQNQTPKQHWEALNQASNSAFQQKDLAKANQLNKEALAYAQANFKENTLELANALHASGMRYVELQNFHDAIAPLEKALAMRKKLLPKGSMAIAETLSGLAESYFVVQDYEKALFAYDGWIMIGSRHNISDLTLAHIWAQMGRAEFRQGKFQDNDVFYNMAVSFVQKHIHEHPEAKDFELLAPQSLKLGINELVKYYRKNDPRAFENLLKKPLIAKLIVIE